jgi:hypothetical protein
MSLELLRDGYAAEESFAFCAPVGAKLETVIVDGLRVPTGECVPLEAPNEPWIEIIVYGRAERAEGE